MAAGVRVAVILILLALRCVNANWWLLGLQGPHTGAGLGLSHKENCHRLQYLVERQQQLCGLSENILGAIGNGAKMSIEECQHQFHMSRWNCTTFSNTSSVFGEVVTIKSRETAFVYAISSAGVAYAVTRACSRGELTECSCDNRVRLRKPRKNWQWGSCSEDIHFGEKFSREFVDARENHETAEGLMNLHNNEAGRRIIRSQMQRVCKCHGMSGSCSVRVCWRKLPSFRQVGDILTARFEGASYVKMVEKRRKRVKKLRAAIRELKQPNRTELVYLEESPDYCERNETLGVLGTRGRLCNRGSPGLDGCRLLCCGRGYQTRVKEVEEKCHCRFVWCCDVKCDLCRYKREEHICN
ncbi:protein Wnt-4-like [Macrosteles quadrilineatus]|uniref:protein Wnt-4-like n=1 Tax=Macrosteles quadrilineatus TaxID=74068 RepID=UPI0023E19F8D|nr:protein Wnt-4-like [Macrosteles quadrilineatus]